MHHLLEFVSLLGHVYEMQRVEKYKMIKSFKHKFDACIKNL